MKNLNIKQNSKVVYEGKNLFLTTYVKSLIEYSDDYANSIASNEFFYLDHENKPDLKDEGITIGYVERNNETMEKKEISCIIPLNRYSFFKSIKTNLLPPIVKYKLM